MVTDSSKALPLMGAKIRENFANVLNGWSRVSVQGVESLWGDCRFILADWGSQ